MKEYKFIKTSFNYVPSFYFSSEETGEERISEGLYNLLHDLTIPPTVEKVCEALEKYIGYEVKHDNDGWFSAFYFEKSSHGYSGVVQICALKGEQRVGNEPMAKPKYIDITYNLPPYLVKLISRYYDGEVKQ